MNIYVGTYTSKDSKGIYNVDFNNGLFSKPVLYCAIDNPKYLYRYKDRIISICDKNKQGGIALIDNERIVDTCLYEDVSSCFVSGKDDYIYTANYHEGTVSLLQINEDDISLIKTISVEKGCGCHQVLFFDEMVLVPCLFLDKIIIFDKNLNELNQIQFPKQSGPRHGIFTENKRYLYVLAELNCHLYKIDMNTLQIVKDIQLVAEDVDGGAAIRINNDYIYCSIRSKNEIAVVSMKDDKLIQSVYCCGNHPRDFIIVDDYLLCANRFSNNFVSFKILGDGTLSEMIDEVIIPEGVALVL